MIFLIKTLIVLPITLYHSNYYIIPSDIKMYQERHGKINRFFTKIDKFLNTLNKSKDITCLIYTYNYQMSKYLINNLIKENKLNCLSFSIMNNNIIYLENNNKIVVFYQLDNNYEKLIGYIFDYVYFDCIPTNLSMNEISYRVKRR